MLTAIHTDTGLYLDRVNTAGGKGGTSTNGPQGRRFFSEELIDTLKKLMPDKHRENILNLHRQISVILAVVSSTRKVNIERFKELCDETSFNICENFSWVRINHTLHGTLHHSPELMIRHDGQALGNLSEEGLEANNKDIRNYLQFLSRKDDPVHQMMDVMARMLERSDPRIINISTQFQTSKYCTECGGKDHTVRSHHRLFASPKTLYSSIVESVFLN